MLRGKGGPKRSGRSNRIGMSKHSSGIAAVGHTANGGIPSVDSSLVMTTVGSGGNATDNRDARAGEAEGSVNLVGGVGGDIVHKGRVIVGGRPFCITSVGVGGHMIWKVAKAVHLHVLVEGLLLQECGPAVRKTQSMRGGMYGTRTLGKQLKASLRKKRAKSSPGLGCSKQMQYA